MNKMWDKLWHKTLRRPYKLAKTLDQGDGLPVVALHGIGQASWAWDPLAKELKDKPFRLIGFDLLGFGKSAKPEWAAYSADDHARAVIKSIVKLKLSQPAILAGHSMGSLVAVRAASLRPDLFKHLILYEMPVYRSPRGTKRYKLRMNFYISMYKKLGSLNMSFTPENRRMGQRLVERVFKLRPDKETWPAFIKSLNNTIILQQTAQEVGKLPMPVDVIFGTRDRLVIRGKTKALFGKDVANVTAHTIREKHRITANAAAFLADRIETAATEKPVAETKKEVYAAGSA
jgi:pimeloyl-ACP methyl ester carboxylesterase